MNGYRNEWKFYCNEIELESIKSKLSNALMYDIHSMPFNEGYTVHSLYFDDYFNSCVFDNEGGYNKRYKYRIRYYNKDKYHIHLERKEKLNGMCRKHMCNLSKDEYEMIINGKAKDLFWKTDNKLLKEFCLDCINKLFVPKLIVDYDRIAYVEPISNVRITFDKNISVSTKTSEFLSDGYIKFPLLNKGMHVLEIKFDDILPSYIKQVININTLKQSSFSKYYLGRKKLERI